MTSPARPQDGSTTRERILDAAEELFAERGLAGTAVRDIAGRVNLNPASLYNHFASKQDLYEAVLARGVGPLIAILEQASASDQEGDWAEKVIATLMQQLTSTPHLPRLIQHEAVSGGEHLARLARKFIAPPVAQALAVARQNNTQSRFSEEELPLLVAAWLNIVMGHFSMAPLLSEVFGADPLSPESLEQQTRFLQKLARILAEP